MKIDIDENSGFCFGVVSAISTAEKKLTDSKKLYCLGDIVHNGQEVNRLANLGLETINLDEFNALSNATVLLRAHGEPPSTYIKAKDNNIAIIDATCKVVLNLQRRIFQAYKQNPNSQIVIYGKQGHAEVLGLVGQTNGSAIVVENIDDLAKVNFNKPVILFSQTTKSLDGFAEIVAIIKKKLSPDIEFKYYDTICRQVANRLPEIKKFAIRYEIIIFVSGAKSSNGKVLYGECKSVNENTIMVSSPEELQPEWFENIQTVGICGATSTPKWLMEAVAAKIDAIDPN